MYVGMYVWMCMCVFVIKDFDGTNVIKSYFRFIQITDSKCLNECSILFIF